MIGVNVNIFKHVRADLSFLDLCHSFSSFGDQLPIPRVPESNGQNHKTSYFGTNAITELLPNINKAWTVVS